LLARRCDDVTMASTSLEHPWTAVLPSLKLLINAQPLIA
jgi:hypothetical protein